MLITYSLFKEQRGELVTLELLPGSPVASQGQKMPNLAPVVCGSYVYISGMAPREKGNSQSLLCLMLSAPTYSENSFFTRKGKAPLPSDSTWALSLHRVGKGTLCDCHEQGPRAQQPDPREQGSGSHQLSWPSLKEHVSARCRDPCFPQSTGYRGKDSKGQSLNTGPSDEHLHGKL